MPFLDPNRLFSANKTVRAIAKSLYDSVNDLPIISPHGHCDPAWFSKNLRFSNPTELFVTPDHYVFRMLVSQGLSLDELGIKPVADKMFEKDPKKIWKKFSENYYLFRGTPTAMWLNYSFGKVFGLQEPLSPANSDFYYDQIEKKLSLPEYLPQALFDKFNIEVLSTTDSAVSNLSNHIDLKKSNWNGKIIPTYRPDSVVDPEKVNLKTT